MRAIDREATRRHVPALQREFARHPVELIVAVGPSADEVREVVVAAVDG